METIHSGDGDRTQNPGTLVISLCELSLCCELLLFMGVRWRKRQLSVEYGLELA